MRRVLYLTIICCILSVVAHAQFAFKGTSLSEALITLDKSSKHYDISFVYDELEDFTVTKTVKRGRTLPEAVREVCGFYPVRIRVKGHDILVECIQKDRTKLTGHLVGPDCQPIAYANITLYPPSDSTYMGGGVSNEAGDFVIPCGAERARVRISCVGFKTIERVMAIGDAGTISMQIENNYLDNVTVSGRMPVIRSEADRLQYIVSNDAFARGLSVEELLSRVPMVNMTGGQAMILGKGPARFMLNGHLAEMGNETIRQKLWTMRSEDVERIEVVSIPSGRHLTEMGGGYINIVLRRGQVPGWRGDVSAEAGVSDDWSGRASGSVSYVSDKFDMTVDAYGGRATQTTDNQTTYADNRIYSDTHSKQTDKELATNLTLRWQPAKQWEVGGLLSWQALWPDREIDGQNARMSVYFQEPIYTQSQSSLSPVGRVGVVSLSAYCDWQLDAKGKLLSLTYNHYKKDDDSKSEVWANVNVKLPYYDYSSNVCEADYRIQSAKLDLTLPGRLATIDAGVSYTSIKNQAHPTMEAYSSFSVRTSLENQDLDYQEKTKAAYLSLHREWARGSVRVGLRYEHVGLDGEGERNNDYYSMDFKPDTWFISYPSHDYWLPSFSLSVRPKDGHQVSFTWGTGCVRPNFYDLNPFRIYRACNEFTQGNPELRPSRTSQMELNYHNHHGLYVCAYHHHGSDVTESFTTISRFDARPYTMTCFQDICRSNQTGLYLRYQNQLAPDLLGTAEGAVYYHDFTSKYSHVNHGWGQRIALSADWYLNRRHTLLLNARYQHWLSDYHGLTKTDGYGYFYFALRYAMLNDRLKLSLVANDPFHQYVTDESLYHCNEENLGYLWGNKINSFSHTIYHAHTISITATYSFGGKKVSHIRHDLRNTESQRAQRRK